MFDKSEQRPFRPPVSQQSVARPLGQYPLKRWSNGNHAELSGQRHNLGIDDQAVYISDTEREGSFQVPTLTADKPFYQRMEQRTIALKNLSDRVTHKDLIEIIRGGAVLDLYLRLNSASVSFLEGAAAQAFLNYTRRHDIYVHNKRVCSERLQYARQC